MGKKKRTEEAAVKKAAVGVNDAEKSAAVTEKKAETKTPAMRKQDARVAAVLRKQEKNRLWAVIAAGVSLFLLTCLSIGESAKGVTMLLLIAGIVIFACRRKAIRARFGVVALLLTVYCVMITVSGFYAPAGKFALSESLKYIGALVLLLTVLAFESEDKAGIGSATAVELSAAAISLLSIDAAGAKLLSAAAIKLLSAFTSVYSDLGALDRGHINSFFGNVNIFSGIAGLGVLLGLGLLSAQREAKSRRVHLVCLAINAAAFLDAFSRGATAVLGVSFVAYLFLERGEARSRALVVMVETALFAGIAAAVGYATAFGSGGTQRFTALAVTILCAAGLAAFDEFVAQRIAEKLSGHTRAVTVAILSLLGAVAVFVVAALNLVGPLSLDAGQIVTREFRPAAGETTLSVTADGDVWASVSYQPSVESFSWDQKPLYSGAADGASFVVPEDCETAFVTLSSPAAVTISDARFDGAQSGSIKLDYKLLPGSVEAGLQGLFSGQSFLQRRVLWRTGLQIWHESPVIGSGVGSFENKSLGIMQFHFETKYAHNHYIQSLVDTGVIGLVLFAGTLLGCAASILLARRKEESSPMLSALGAALLFMAGQATTDVIFSSSWYLFSAFIVFALIEVCSGAALSLPGGKKTEVWLPRSALALLCVWVVLLGANLYAHALQGRGTYNDLVTAANIDRYERNDYRLSYVYSACTFAERTEEMTEQMYAYMEELEKVPSNTIPYYLGYAYFNLGDTAKAFEMLKQYTAYSASDENKWDASYRLASQYISDDAAYVEGLSALYQSMLEWNTGSLKPIVLQDDVQGFVTGVTGLA